MDEKTYIILDKDRSRWDYFESVINPSFKCINTYFNQDIDKIQGAPDVVLVDNELGDDLLVKVADKWPDALRFVWLGNKSRGRFPIAVHYTLDLNYGDSLTLLNKAFGSYRKSIL